MEKNLYKGIFNYVQENYEMFTYAISTDKAFLNFISQLNKKAEFTDLPKRTIMYCFNGQKDNFYIEKIRKND